MKLIITGGHPTPAFALVEYLQQQPEQVEIVFIGRTTTRSSDHQPSPEQMMAKQHQVKFIGLNPPKFGSSFSFQNLGRLILLFVYTVKALLIINRVKPDLIVSFGSYLAVPVAIAGYISGISLITHEQTRGLGRANQLIAHLAKTLALSHVITQKTTASQVLTGNLLRPSLFVVKSEAPDWWPKSYQLPILYITGGEQGSEVINSTVSQILPQLLKSFIVIHQCGPASQKRNYHHELIQLKKTFSSDIAKRYVVKEWLSGQELSYLYHQKPLVLSRSGANTVDELMAFHLPSVLVPLPFSQGGEQMENALSLAHLGAALILEQKDLRPETLQKTLLQLKLQADTMRAAFPNDVMYTQASQKLWQLIKSSAKT